MTRAVLFQMFRKVVQVSALLFIAYAAVGMHWRNFKVAHNSSRLVALHTNDVTGELYWRNQQLLSLFGDPLAVSEGLLGGPWAATVAGVPVTDPYALAAVVASGTLPPLAMVLGALGPVLLAVVLGRVFCSFLCPARLAFEFSSALRRGLMFLGLDFLEVRLPRMGLWVGAAALAFSAFAGPAVFHFVLPYYALSSAVLAGVMSGTIGVMVAWVGLMMFVDAFVAPGQICHALCPTGALLEQLGRRSLVRVALRDTDCPPSCDVCQRACPYGLYPGKQTHRPSCDTCGRCTVACPQRKLHHRFGMAAAMVLALACAPMAQAHHNKGLPHYGYFENYPQVPTEEFIDEVGRWEVGAVFFNFQGMQRRTSDTPNDVRVFAYAYDLEEDRGYKGGATLHIDYPDGRRVASFERLEPDQEGVFVLRQEIPESGDFVLVFELHDAPDEAVVPLDIEVDLSVDRVQWGLLGGGAAGVGALFVVAVLGRRSKGARRAPAAV